MKDLKINRQEARAAIESLAQGLAPKADITNYMSVGLDKDMEVFDDEYFGVDGLLRNTDQGTFKLVEAYYGGGKTHYLRSIERLAHINGFASAFIELHKDSCPLTRFDLIYKGVAEHLTVPSPEEGKEPPLGLAAVIRSWITPNESCECEDISDAIKYAAEKILSLGDLPLPSLRIALGEAAMAAASKDRATLDELLVYLHSGKIAPPLKKRGILESIDVRNGALALRSLAIWLRQIGYPGFVLVMDEGDRSLSISSTKDRTTASNNLVQLINETLKGADWPGVMLLYSIPSWQDFQNSLSSNNMALDQRLRNTGFPNLPPAPRICLDDRYPSDIHKQKFCLEVALRLYKIFLLAYPKIVLTEEDASNLADMVAKVVVQEVLDVSYCRKFIQSYIGVLYWHRKNVVVTVNDISLIVRGDASQLSD